MQRTEGYSRGHALGKGMAAAKAKGATWEWIDPKCDDCTIPTDKLYPMAVNEQGRQVDESTQWNILVCYECSMKRM